MEGVIKLLPDLVANQIAAGEVIQRPASAVKELMENAVDAGSSVIELWVNDAGKKLIMVVDEGSGMSPADSRLCFERHATSKISQTDDLFKIRTLGFRGEALASIAAVAQLELKSRREGDELATLVRIEGSKLVLQEPATHPVGTTIAVKNLFFNVPARRNFLKGNNVELKHIVEEFTRVALANETITFRMFNDGREMYHLPAGNLKQRIINLYGSHYNTRFVPVSQDTEIVNISGFIGKPEFSRKTRGEQYFFVNGRFFKHSYLHHSVLKAYTELIPESSFPSYFIFLNVDPAQVDVNIHPTKTEVNFIENQAIYAILHTAVRNSLGKFSLTPSIEFEPEAGFNEYFSKDRELKQPTITINPDYNPFDNQASRPDSRRTGSGSFASQTSMLNQRGWEKLYEGTSGNREGNKDETIAGPLDGDTSDELSGLPEARLFQMHSSFIVTSIKSGLLVINQQLAHQRILYERFISVMAKSEPVSQKLLFPIELLITKEDMITFGALNDHLRKLGFDFTLEEEGKVMFSAIPSDMPAESVAGVIEGLMHEWNEEREPATSSGLPAKIARFMANRLSIKTGTHLSNPEMQALVDQLFSSEHPETAPGGNPVFIVIPKNELEERFSKLKH